MSRRRRRRRRLRSLMRTVAAAMACASSLLVLAASSSSCARQVSAESSVKQPAAAKIAAGSPLPAAVAPHRAEPVPSGIDKTTQPPSQQPNPRRAILVTVDGVRWQDLFEGADRSRIGDPRRSFGDAKTRIDDLTRPEGLLPRTWELISKSGVALGHGAGCGVVRPRNTTHISLPGYYEIFTGHRTRCMSNVCPHVTIPTFLDAAAAAGMSAASIGSWEMLEAAATSSPPSRIATANGVFVSAGIAKWPVAKRPLADPRLEELVAEGERAKPYPAPNGTYRPDRYTTAIALEYLRVNRPRVLHVGLGDMDEHAHRDDYTAYLLSLREADTFLGELADTLEALGLSESTTVIVTSDHGRASARFREHGPAYPDSGRSFVIAFGAALGNGNGAGNRGEACAHHDLWLTDIATTMRVILGLPRDSSADAIGKPIEEIVARR